MGRGERERELCALLLRVGSGEGVVLSEALRVREGRAVGEGRAEVRGEPEPEGLRLPGCVGAGEALSEDVGVAS